MLHCQILLQWAEQKKTQQLNCSSAAVKSQAAAQCPWTSMAGGAGRAVLAELLLPHCPGSKQTSFTVLECPSSKQMSFTVLQCSYYCFLSAQVALEVFYNGGRRGSGKGAAPAAVRRADPARSFEVPYSALLFLPITE